MNVLNSHGGNFQSVSLNKFYYISLNVVCQSGSSCGMFYSKFTSV